MSYFNTNNEAGETLKKSQISADAQEERVLNIIRFGYNVSQPLVREIYLDVFGVELKVASCARAFSNLTKAGKLMKNGKDNMVMGTEGKMVNTWRRLSY